MTKAAEIDLGRPWEDREEAEEVEMVEMEAEAEVEAVAEAIPTLTPPTRVTIRRVPINNWATLKP